MNFGFTMWTLWLNAFAEKKIDINAIPKKVWEESLNLSKGRITKEFVKWFVEEYLKLAKSVKVEKDTVKDGQFLIKDDHNYLLFIVRDFVIAEKTTSKDYIKTERVYLNKRAESEGAQLELIKKTFKKLLSKDGLMIKGPGKFSTIIEIENAMYVYPFSENVELVGAFKKERIYVTVTDVRHQGQRVEELLGQKGEEEMLENIGKSLALWHLKSKFAARVGPYDMGFATIVHDDFRPENVLYYEMVKKITFLNNDQMSDVIEKSGKSNLYDIKTFIKDLNAKQKTLFLKGYVSLFKKKGYTLENMEEFTRSEMFKILP